jgi:hypothetical protein
VNKTSRRVKVVRMPQSVMIDLFNYWMDCPRFIRVPVGDEIPRDAVVVGVQACWHERCIDVMIEHHSFPEVEEGVHPGYLPWMCLKFMDVEIDGVITHDKEAGRMVVRPRENAGATS